MTAVTDEWRKRTDEALTHPCTSCAQAGFEIIELSEGKQNLSTADKHKYSIPPSCRTTRGLNLTLFCMAKHAYVPWPPIACDLYTDATAEKDLDHDFLNR